ncbi:SURF1 family cytochrome oxidase biogenesis protein [Leifsonia sp. NPDC058194]|uniref:SURF1 family cytochrome oxidase biogenesis protein n=1 Tax=Leifsonia sp. NPDC058194 TaxID=3346374 RepID=UPI0036DEB129
MMLRPRWIGALVFALALAAGFAALGQWQLERALESGKAVEAPSETVLPLADIAKPGGPITDKAVGQLVEFTGTFVPGDYQILDGRLNEGKTGWWVIGHVNLEEPDGTEVAMAVARGWAPDEATAKSAVARLSAEPESAAGIVGRILPDEQPEVPQDKSDPTQMRTVGIGALYNLWTGVDGMDVYSAYVVQRGGVDGLDAIYSPPPIAETELNWLNIFYAAEWIIFAGFAIFLWYRLVKDAKQREDELRELAEEEAAASASAGSAAVTGKVE